MLGWYQPADWRGRCAGELLVRCNVNCWLRRSVGMMRGDSEPFPQFRLEDDCCLLEPVLHRLQRVSQRADFFHLIALAPVTATEDRERHGRPHGWRVRPLVQ